MGGVCHAGLTRRPGPAWRIACPLRVRSVEMLGSQECDSTQVGRFAAGFGARTSTGSPGSGGPGAGFERMDRGRMDPAREQPAPGWRFGRLLHRAGTRGKEPG